MANIHPEHSHYKHPFPEEKVREGQPPRCVDGRPAENSLYGPQMLGGSLHPVLLYLIQNNLDFNKDNALMGFKKLQDTGHTLGFHRGSHYNPENAKSDCGMADNLPFILQTALQKKDSILQQLHTVFQTNEMVQNLFNKNETLFSKHILEHSYSIMETYGTNRVTFNGDALMKAVEEDPDLNVYIEVVEGDHKEEKAVLNLKEDVTLNRIELNEEYDKQAFNLDIKHAIKQAESLGVESKFAIGSSLILYVAAKIVLAEKDPAQDPLPIEVHS